MERITPRLCKVGNYYVREDDDLCAADVRENPDAKPIDLLWKIREEARRTFGEDYVGDTIPDEPIRRVVGRVRARDQKADKSKP